MASLFVYLPRLLAYPFYRISMVQQVDDSTSGLNPVATARDIYDNATERPFSNILFDLWEFTSGQGIRNLKGNTSARISSFFNPQGTMQHLACKLLATSITHPFDLLLARSSSDLTGRYSTTMKSVMTAYADNGVFTFYNGWGANMLRTGLQHLVTHQVDTLLLQCCQKSLSSGNESNALLSGNESNSLSSGNESNSLFGTLALHVAALWLRVLLLQPVRVVQNRQMAHGVSIGESCKQLFERHGVFGFFRGFVALGLSVSLELVADFFSVHLYSHSVDNDKQTLRTSYAKVGNFF